ncbi:MAG: hypothetical protein LQ342_006727 [Letrouitia transgressa]|nr:MAG: hypothetical protein LQ342_006727 [Letrouitia transgressa]
MPLTPHQLANHSPGPAKKQVQSWQRTAEPHEQVAMGQKAERQVPREFKKETEREREMKKRFERDVERAKKG